MASSKAAELLASLGIAEPAPVVQAASVPAKPPQDAAPAPVGSKLKIDKNIAVWVFHNVGNKLVTIEDARKTLGDSADGAWWMLNQVRTDQKSAQELTKKAIALIADDDEDKKKFGDDGTEDLAFIAEVRKAGEEARSRGEVIV